MTSAALNRLLDQAAAALDIPEDVAEDAILQYESVAAWLGEEGSPLRDYSPEIYPQGSFRLGTPIRPLLRGEEFDIDLVCRLAIPKENITQKDLKQRVGDRLRQNDELSKILAPKRRCWTLSYKARFHLDVLPAIPDFDAGDDSILLTDTELTRWQHSNPIGYANWFFECMRAVYEEQRAALAEAAGVSVEDVPRWRTRAPLQRAVQLLKRHRDLRFPLGSDDRPASIVITTLAARAYRQQTEVYSALLGLARSMPHYIENRAGRWWIANPAHPEENFADKWNEKPGRKDAFVRWLRAVEADLGSAAAAPSDAAADQIVRKQFGPGSGLAKVAVSAAVPALADSSHLHGSRWLEQRVYHCRVRGWVYPAVRRGKGTDRVDW